MILVISAVVAIILGLFLLHSIKLSRRELPGPKGIPILGSAISLGKNPFTLHTLLEGWSEEFGSVYEVALVHKRLVISKIKIKSEKIN